jgi:RNA polymerase sigma-70 factor (ECF subfamily)
VFWKLAAKMHPAILVPVSASESTAGWQTSGANATRPGSPVFLTTRWSVVVKASGGDSSSARQALANLCQHYWYPLYAYVRRRGYSPPDAEDLTQEFFAQFLAHGWVAQADRGKGRFRTFLLSALNHFLANQWDKARAQKRGGGVPLLPLEFSAAEARYVHESADHATPEQHFERRWATTLLETVLQRLQAEYDDEDKRRLFSALHPCLVGDRIAQPYDVLAQSLGLTESAVKSAVHRLRQRYRQLLREEIAQTVDAPGEVEAELRHLIGVLAGRPS